MSVDLRGPSSQRCTKFAIDIERVRNALTLMGRLAGYTTTLGVLSFWTLERGGNKDLDISLIQRFPGALKI